MNAVVKGVPELRHEEVVPATTDLDDVEKGRRREMAGEQADELWSGEKVLRHVDVCAESLECETSVKGMMCVCKM